MRRLQIGRHRHYYRGLWPQFHKSERLAAMMDVPANADMTHGTSPLVTRRINDKHDLVVYLYAPRMQDTGSSSPSQTLDHTVGHIGRNCP